MLLHKYNIITSDPFEYNYNNISSNKIKKNYYHGIIIIVKHSSFNFIKGKIETFLKKNGVILDIKNFLGKNKIIIQKKMKSILQYLKINVKNHIKIMKIII